MKRTIALMVLFAIIVLPSCNSLIVRPVLRKLSNELVIEEIKSHNKEVIFIKMVHVAQPKFYDEVAKELTIAKENGAVLFYEYIDYDITDTLILRKTQKIAGFIPSPKNYKTITKNIIKKGKLETQNNAQFLNIVNNQDFRVDYTPQRLVDEYEEKFGKIVLTKEDLELPLDAVNKNTVPIENYETIILNHRNKYLAKEVNESNFNKIVILYGGDHFPGFLEELNKLDSSWESSDKRIIKIKK